MARSEKQQQLELPPEKTAPGSSKPEFQWPTGVPSAPEMPTQLHYAQEMPGAEAVGYANTSSTHMSPIHAHQPQQYQQWMPTDYAQQPHELAGSSGSPVPVPRHELEGELNPVPPRAWPTNRPTQG